MSTHFLSATELNRGQVEELFLLAQHFLDQPKAKSRAFDRVIGLWFQEASTRTRVGFEVAALRLGAEPFAITQKKFTERMSVEESFEDTLRILSDYSDLLCVRGDEDFVDKLSLSSCPVINCGNGDDEHPTQALIDLFTISQFFDQIDGLRICIVGDLRHMRTAHSLVRTLSLFDDLHLDLVSPSLLSLPQQYLVPRTGKNNTILETEDLESVIAKADVIYMTGFAPKTPVGTFDDAIRQKFQLNSQSTAKLKDRAIILCPLPRIDEILPEVDVLPQAKYFAQSKFGLSVRMALLDRFI